MGIVLMIVLLASGLVGTIVLAVACSPLFRAVAVTLDHWAGECRDGREMERAG